MSLATSNRDGGRTNEAGHLRGVTRGFIGEVLNGLNVTQRTAGANMSVDVAIGDAIIQRSDNTYGHPAWNDAAYNQVIAAADGSNPRRDIIVMYIDYGQTPSTGVANNTNGVVKITSVAGTAAGSPVDPSNVTIQSAVGSGNPFIKLARVRVAAGSTSVTNSVIDDLRLMATAQLHGGWVYDTLFSWVYASASSFTIAGVDATSQFPVGARLAFYQAGTLKYFTVLSAAFSTNTTVTVDGGGTYVVANVPIDRPAFSYQNSPSGFPRSVLNDQLEGYTEIARTTLTATATVISVLNIPPKRHLRVLCYGVASGGTIDSNIKFNSDAGANYAANGTNNGAAYSSISSNALACDSSFASSGQPVNIILDFDNQVSISKIGHFFSNNADAAGAATIPRPLWAAFKWTGSAQVSRLDWNNTTGTGSFAIGSKIIVLGKD